MLLLPLVVAVVASVAGVFRLRLPAERESSVVLRRALSDWLANGSVDKQVAFEITLACVEAFNNAVEHPIEPTHTRVEIEGELTDGELWLSLRDHGRWRDDPLDRAAGRGHGLTLMRALADSVDIEAADQGSTVTLRRRI